MPARRASWWSASTKESPSRFIRKAKTSPLSLQPKQWKKPWSSLTWKEGAVSEWKGQSPE